MLNVLAKNPKQIKQKQTKQAKTNRPEKGNQPLSFLAKQDSNDNDNNVDHSPMTYTMCAP
jgi:hypothetical protein